MNAPGLQKKWNKLKATETEGEGYDMCQAILEMQEESFTKGKNEGFAQGKTQGKTQGSLEKTKNVVRNMLKRGFSDEDICALAECTAEFIESMR